MGGFVLSLCFYDMPRNGGQTSFFSFFSFTALGLDSWAVFFVFDDMHVERKAFCRRICLWRLRVAQFSRLLESGLDQTQELTI